MSYVGNGTSIPIIATNLFSHSNSFINGILTVSAASSALTISVKTRAGNDPSTADPVYVIYRNATSATGDMTILTLIAATSFTISSGSTLGVTSSTAFRIWVVGFNDAGTFRLGVINCSTSTNIYSLNDGVLASSTAEGGAGAADSAGIFYTGTAVSSKAFRILGYIEWSSSGLTAGTWTTTNLLYTQLFGPGIKKPGDLIKMKMVTSTGTASTTGTTYVDGGFSGGTITPESAANIIKVTVCGTFRQSTSGVRGYCRLARTSNSNMFGTENTLFVTGTAPIIVPVTLQGIDAPNSISSITYLVMIKDGSGGTTIWNGESVNCSMILEEYMS